jgi:hypothetical protein
MQLQQLWAQNKPPSMLNDALADVSVHHVMHAPVAVWRAAVIAIALASSLGSSCGWHAVDSPFSRSIRTGLLAAVE